MPAGLKPASASPDSTCASCSKTQRELGVPLKACGGCKTVLYCSKKCQDVARKAHGAECQEIRAGGGTAKAPARTEEAPAARPRTEARPAAQPSQPVAQSRDRTPATSFDTPYIQVRTTPSTDAKPDPSSASAIPTLGPAHPTLPGIPQAKTLMDMLDSMSIAGKSGGFMSTISGGKASGAVKASESGLGNLIRSSKSNAYLSALSEREAIRQLIDCFRMRCEDEYKFNGLTVGLYNDDDPVIEFNKFLALAEQAKVLPDWWSGARRAEARNKAQDQTGKCCIHQTVEKADVIAAYDGDSMMPMKLRGLAERVYGTPVMRN